MSTIPQLILGSASPRRRELLSRLGIEFIVDPANIEEVVPDRIERAEEIARQLASDKAIVVAERHPSDVVFAADTIVVHEDRLLAKPEDPDDAWQMLRALQGRQHRVITGLALARDGNILVDHAVTLVVMREYSDEEIAAYIESGQPFDKAGGYAIQDAVFRPVAHYQGCYCNVVGLPLAPAIGLLYQAGFVPRRSNLLPECARCPLFQHTAPGEIAGR